MTAASQYMPEMYYNYVKNVIPSVVIPSDIIRFIVYTRSLQRLLFVLSGILFHYMGYNYVGYIRSFHRIFIRFVIMFGIL